MTSNESNEHLEHHSAFMDYKLKRKKWADNAVDCWNGDIDPETENTTTQQLYKRSQDSQIIDKPAEVLPMFEKQDSGYVTSDGQAKISGEDIQEAKNTDSVKSEQEYDSGICSESGSSRCVSRSGAICNNSPLSMCMSPSANSNSSGGVASSDENSSNGASSFYKQSLEPVYEVTAQDLDNDEECDEVEAQTDPLEPRSDCQQWQQQGDTQTGYCREDNDEHQSCVVIETNKEVTENASVNENDVEQIQQQQEEAIPTILQDNYANEQAPVGNNSINLQNSSSDNPISNMFGMNADLPKMDVMIDTPYGPQTVRFPILCRHPRTYAYVTNKDDESESVLDLSAENDSLKNYPHCRNETENNSVDQRTDNVANVESESNSVCDDKGSILNRLNSASCNQSHTNICTCNDEKHAKCTKHNQQSSETEAMIIEPSNPEVPDDPNCRPLMTWEKFNQAAGITVDLCKEVTNPLMDGFGLSGMSLMMGRLPNIEAKGNEQNNETSFPLSHRTNWAKLSMIQQAQIEQIKVNKKEAEDCHTETSMLCEVCDDRATGLHYGVVSCEGCKGFFKRSVQNRRVYACIGTGQCEINKVKRNRCQFCRFNKCLIKGMIMAAVREDRMPGGRNSGAVYNLYKMKYRRHKQKIRSCDSSTTSSYTSDSTLTSDSECGQSNKRYSYTPERARVHSIGEMGEVNNAPYLMANKDSENNAPCAKTSTENDVPKAIITKTEKSIGNLLKLTGNNPLVAQVLTSQSGNIHVTNNSLDKTGNNIMNRNGLTYPFQRKLKGPRNIAPVEVGSRKFRFGCHPTVPTAHMTPMINVQSVQDTRLGVPYVDSRQFISAPSPIGSVKNEDTDVYKNRGCNENTRVYFSPDKKQYFSDGMSKSNVDHVVSPEKEVQFSSNQKSSFEKDRDLHQRDLNRDSSSQNSYLNGQNFNKSPVGCVPNHMYSSHPSQNNLSDSSYTRNLIEKVNSTKLSAAQVAYLHERENYSRERLHYISGNSVSTETHSSQAYMALNHSKTYSMHSSSLNSGPKSTGMSQDPSSSIPESYQPEDKRAFNVVEMDNETKYKFRLQQISSGGSHGVPNASMFNWPGAAVLSSMSAGFGKQNSNPFSCTVTNSAMCNKAGYTPSSSVSDGYYLQQGQGARFSNNIFCGDGNISPPKSFPSSAVPINSCNSSPLIGLHSHQEHSGIPMHADNIHMREQKYQNVTQHPYATAINESKGSRNQPYEVDFKQNNHGELYQRQAKLNNPNFPSAHKDSQSGSSHELLNKNVNNSFYYNLVEEMATRIRDKQRYSKEFDPQTVISRYLSPSTEDLNYHRQRRAVISGNVPSSHSENIPDRIIHNIQTFSENTDENRCENTHEDQHTNQDTRCSNTPLEPSHSDESVRDKNEPLQGADNQDCVKYHSDSAENNLKEQCTHPAEQYQSINCNNKKDDDQLSTVSASSTSSNDSRSTFLLIQQLMNWEDFENGLTKQQLPSEESQSMSDIYSKLGDEIMCEIVRWMKKLPFYCLISLSAHTETLEKHWHHVLLLAICVNQAWEQMRKHGVKTGTHIDSEQYLVRNLQTLHSYLTVKLGRCIKFEDFFNESGKVVERITKLICQFTEIGVTREEYVVLKVLLLLHSDSRVMEKVRHCYIMALKEFLQEKYPEEPNRFSKLMGLKSAVEDCADCLMEQKMIHVPFLLN